MGIFEGLGGLFNNLGTAAAAGLAKPGASQGLMALGSQLMAYGQPAIGAQGLAQRNQHLANAAPAMQNAMMAQQKAERDAEMFKLQKEQLARANKMAQLKWDYYQKLGKPSPVAQPVAPPVAQPVDPEVMAEAVGTGAPLPNQTIAGPAPAMFPAGLGVQPRQQAAPQAAMKAPTAGDYSQAAVEKALIGIDRTPELDYLARRTAYKERKMPLPGGMIQEQVRRNGVWEDFGAPYSRRDPWVVQKTTNPETGAIEERAYKRSELERSHAQGLPLSSRPNPNKFKPLAGDDLGAFEEAKRAWGAIKKLKAGLPESGLFKGQLSKGQAKLGYNKKAIEFESALNAYTLSAQALIKGTPSDFDIQTIIRTLPELGLPESVNKSRLEISEQNFKNLVEDKIGYLKALGHQIPPFVNKLAREMGVDPKNVDAWDRQGDPFRTPQAAPAENREIDYSRAPEGWEQEDWDHLTPKERLVAWPK